VCLLTFVAWDRERTPELPPAGPYLIAYPNPVPPGGAPGRTTIAWSTGTTDNGEVYVVADGNKRLFATGIQGREQAAWITGDPFSRPFEFRLYTTGHPATPLATLTVGRDDDIWSFGSAAAANLLWCGLLAGVVVLAERRSPAGSKSFIRSASVTGAVSAGIAATVLVFRPGVMSPDSLGQFREALTGVFTMDASPPMMSFVWRQLLRVIPGPLGMMVFHASMFWIGLGLIAAACTTSAVGGSLLVLGTGFFPPVFALLGTLWKDVGLGAAFTLVVGMILMGQKQGSRRLVLLSFLPLFYGTAVRFNAAPAAFPLACLLCVALAGPRRASRRNVSTLLAVSTLVTVFLVALVSAVNAAVVSQRSTGANLALQGSMLHDLAGMSLRTRTLLVPEYLRRPPISLEWLRERYKPGDGGNSFLYQFDFIFAQDEQQYKQLQQAWRTAVISHPSSYLAQRGQVILTIFQIRGIYDPFHRRIDPNTLGLVFPSRPVYERTVAFLDDVTALFFRGWFFLALAFVVAVAGARRRVWSAVAVAASGICYVLPYVAVTGGSDFRYIWWMLLAALLSFTVLMCHQTSCLPRPCQS